MAITYVGSGAASDAVNDNAITPSIHASTAVGDLIIFTWGRFHDAGDSGDLTTVYANANVTGYTSLVLKANLNATAELLIMGKIATGTDTINVVPPDGTDATGDMSVGRTHTFRSNVGFGAIGTVTHAHNEITTNSENGTLTHPSLTILLDGTLLFVSGFKGSHQWTSAAVLTTNSFGWAEVDDTASGQGSDGSIVSDYVIQTSATNLSSGGFTITGDSGAITTAIAISLIDLEQKLPVSVSTAYKVSVSASDVTSVDLELSALAYGLSATSEDESNVAAALDLISSSGLTAKVSTSPVYVIDQSGMVANSTSAAYKVSITFAAGSVFPDVTPQTTYKVSASTSAVLLIADNVDVNSTYKVSVSVNAFLQVQSGINELTVDSNYQVTASSEASLFGNTTGGLVWSRKKSMYIPVRIG